MLLAVAGLTEEEIKTRTERLASGDWSVFSDAEQSAFRFAHKQTKEPWAIDDNDIKELRGHFGNARALDLVWYGAWCNYMTRVADAIQLPLEQENVFGGPRPKEKKK